MWCPKCKNEYVPGITKCTDCGIDLVESLEEFEAVEEQAKQTAMEEMYQPLPDETDSSFKTDIEEKASFSAPAHAYVSKKAKTEDIKSTAYTFTLVGIAGIIVVILFAIGVLPLHTAGYMKVIISIVMGALFVIFLGIGIRSFQQIKTVTEEAATEENLLSEATEWFRTNFDRTAIDEGLDTTEAEETLYFSRYQKMHALILAQYPDMEESLLDHIIDTLYSEIF